MLGIVLLASSAMVDLAGGDSDELCVEFVDCGVLEVFWFWFLRDPFLGMMVAVAECRAGLVLWYSIVMVEY